MSSATGLEARLPQAQVIDLDQAEERRVGNPLDADGDGVVDGQSLSGGSGAVENQDLVAILAARGMQVNSSGAVASDDGFTLNSTNSTVALDFMSGVPSLPPAEGEFLSSDAWRASFDWLYAEGMSDGALMWEALSTMARTSMRDMSDAKELKHAMQEGKIENKKNEIDATEAQIEAERRAAAEKFLFSVVAAVASIAMSQFAGGKYAAAGGAVGDVLKTGGEYLSKTAGAQRDADEARLMQMRYQMMQEMFDQGVETAKASYDEARELFKQAMKILDEHAERESQITSNITRS